MDFKKIKGMVYNILGISSENNVPLNLTAEQKRELDKVLKKEGFAERFEAKHNKEMKAEQENKEVNDAITSFMEEEAGTEASSPSATDATETKTTLLDNVNSLTANLVATRKENRELKVENEFLKNSPELDNPEKIKGNMTPTIQHSATHLYGSNNSWDAFEGRPWNQQIARIEGAAETSWDTANIDRLNNDIQNYFRKDPKKLFSTFIDGLKLPKHWKLISGVSDEYIFTTISTGEITQGLKAKWIPKNKVEFAAQKGKVRDIEIDIEFRGDKLKKLEKSYLNHFFDEGSTPFKDNFIMFVVKELMNQARKEDKVCFGKGVYFPNNLIKAPGSFLNNFSGVIKLSLDARGALYKPFKLGRPTKENIFDYIKDFAESLPHEVKNLPGLVFYLSPSWLRRYNDARRIQKGGNQDFKGDIYTIDGFSNIELEAYDQLEGYDFMFLTTEDNIMGLSGKPGEESVLQFQKSTRDTKAIGNYKLAAFIAMFGRNLIDVKANSYENQLFFSNDVEALTDVYVPVPENTSEPSLTYHNSLMIGAHNTRPTDIINFKDVKPNTKIYLLGNGESNFSTVKNGEKINLINSDCVLTKNTLLVLYAKADGTFQELERRNIGVVEQAETEEILSQDATEIDASLGTHFRTSSNSKATSIEKISNAVSGETYRIIGGSDTNATEIKNSGSFVLTEKMVLDNEKFIELYYNGSKFIETARG